MKAEAQRLTKMSSILNAAADIREAIRNKESKMSWQQRFIRGGMFSKSPKVDEIIFTRSDIWSSERKD